jgi:long-chain fatty acid transport protein
MAHTTVLRARPRPSTLATLLVLGGVLVAPNIAEASGFLTARYGADHGNPVGDNPFSIYFNPAALGAVQGTQISIDAALVYRLASYERGADALSPAALANEDPGSAAYKDYKRSNTGKATIGNVLALPFLGVATDFGGSKYFHGGFAVYVPYGGLASWSRNTDFDSSLAPGGNDGPQRWFNISGRILSIYSTAAFAVTAPKARLSVGVNVSLVYNTLETVRARNPNGSDDTGTANQIIEGRSLIDASGVNLAAGIGLYWEPVAGKVKLGASYTIRPGFGPMRLGGELRTQFGINDNSEPIELLQQFPDVWRVGAAWRVNPRLELRLDGEYVTWSKFKNQCLVNAGQNASCELNADGSERAGRNVVIQNIDRNWKDAFSVRAGAGVFLNPATELFGSVLFDSSAVPATTLDPTFIDAPKIHWVLGVRREITSKLALAGSFNHVYYFEQDTTGKNVFYSRVADSRQPSAAGVYNQQLFYLNVNGTYRF